MLVMQKILNLVFGRPTTVKVPFCRHFQRNQTKSEKIEFIVFFKCVCTEKHALSVRQVQDSIRGPVQLAQCRRCFAIFATFLRSCVSQALNRRE